MILQRTAWEAPYDRTATVSSNGQVREEPPPLLLRILKQYLGWLPPLESGKSINSNLLSVDMTKPLLL